MKKAIIVFSLFLVILMVLSGCSVFYTTFERAVNATKDNWLFANKNEPLPKISFTTCLGGSDKDIAQSIRQTTDGGYIVAGYTYSNDGDVSGNHGGADYWIVKLNKAGNIQWQKCLGGSDDEYAQSIQQTSDGGYIVAGQTDSGDVFGNLGFEDSWIVKLNNNGELQWQKYLGGSRDDSAESIQQTKDGGYIVAGQSNSNNGDVSGNHGEADVWIVKLDY